MRSVSARTLFTAGGIRETTPAPYLPLTCRPQVGGYGYSFMSPSALPSPAGESGFSWGDESVLPSFRSFFSSIFLFFSISLLRFSKLYWFLAKRASVHEPCGSKNTKTADCLHPSMPAYPFVTQFVRQVM